MATWSGVGPSRFAPFTVGSRPEGRAGLVHGKPQGTALATLLRRPRPDRHTDLAVTAVSISWPLTLGCRLVPGHCRQLSGRERARFAEGPRPPGRPPDSNQAPNPDRPPIFRPAAVPVPGMRRLRSPRGFWAVVCSVPASTGRPHMGRATVPGIGPPRWTRVLPLQQGPCNSAGAIPYRRLRLARVAPDRDHPAGDFQQDSEDSPAGQCASAGLRHSETERGFGRVAGPHSGGSHQLSPST